MEDTPKEPIPPVEEPIPPVQLKVQDAVGKTGAAFPAQTPKVVVPVHSVAIPKKVVEGIAKELFTKEVNDGKFYGKLFKVKDDTEVPMDEVFVLTKWDKAIIPTLKKYAQFSEWANAKLDQLISIEKKIVEVEEWQKANKDRIKVADMP